MVVTYSVLNLARVSTFHQSVCPQSTRFTPQRWSIHPQLLIPMSLEDRHPFKTRVPAIGTTLGVLCTPRQSSHSGQYLQELGQGQGRPPELLTSTLTTWDSPLPSRIKQHHMGVPHGKTPSTIHIIQTSITHHITRNICNYDGVNASKQTGIYISVSAELGNQGEVVSIKENKAQAIACITYSSKGINVKR